MSRFVAKPLALSGGDPAGIGLEIAIKAWKERHNLSVPPFFLIADPQLVEDRMRLCRLPVALHLLEDPICIHDCFREALPVVPLRAHQTSCVLGQPSPAHAAGIIEAIERGVDFVMANKAGALVTCPIAKKPLYDAGFAFPGHTEFLNYLAQKATGQSSKAVMMLAGEQLRCVPITIHIALSQVTQQLTADLIIETALIVARDVRDFFALPHPRLAVAGLNPHAGENGEMGLEDEQVVRPAVKQLQKMGLNIIGPLPADTMFHAHARKNYNVALCMYHDQALIPVKTLDFETSVNVTLGLPFIRTSPDHGTAFDIAEQAIASPNSLIAALRLAAQMAQTKQETIREKHNVC